MAFEKVTPRVNFPELEREVLEFWQGSGAFRKSVESRPEERPYVFYEGPPTANGRPGFHHVLARAFKDLIPRYKTMRGYRVERKGGWDCHGLPVELEVEKELGLSGKRDVEEYGVEEFNRLCRESVFRYVDDWKRMSDRMGFWANMEDAYWTLDNTYIESVWWALKELYGRDLLYEGYKVTAHCPRDQTSLSSAEVAMGYEDVVDPSVYVKLPLEDEENTSLLVWTTTPWTLVSNAAVAAHPEVEYATVELDGERLVLAEELLQRVLGEGGYRVVERRRGTELEGLRYRRPFDYVPVEETENLWTVVLGDYVTTSEGTGLVHTAPAYGEDDQRTGRRYGLPTIHPVRPDGTFDERVGPFAGQFVKEADAGLVEELRERGLLFRAGEYEHAYPHCWRCGTPLLYYAKRAWYARTTAVLDELLRENERINWLPEHIKWGRFGDWLRNNVDWALSRERYWGTPLPIWRTASGETVVVGSVEELRELAIDPVPDDLHRPYIDRVRIRHPETGEEARRVPEVLDAWFDSGSMPFAQWGYPHRGRERFERQFPADYICEAVDQTRGWFYSLLAVSTLLFGRSSYKTCLVLGHVLDAEGKKMSKSRGNVVDPWEVFENQGADALRWALYTATSPGNPRRFSLEQVDEAVRKYLLTLWNTYAFFVTYARIDGFDPGTDSVPLEERGLLDRWVLSELNLTVKTVTERMDAYDVTAAGRALGEFVDELSNWYVRRSRRRFWKSEDDVDKRAAHSTLYECLAITARLTAPFTPFVAEKMYRNLVVNAEPGAPESVHLADWPRADEALIDHTLSGDMAAARKAVTLGRAARNAAGIKTRQPLGEVVIAAPEEAAAGIRRLREIVLDELNVKELRFGSPEDVVSYTLKPNLKVVGPKYGRLVPQIRRALEEAGPDAGARAAAGEPVTLSVDGREVTLAPAELLVEAGEREGYAVERERDFAVALKTELTPGLREEGLVRELVHRVQNLRREQGLEIEDTIAVSLGGSERVRDLLRGGWGEYFRSEVLARELVLDGEPPDGSPELEVEGERVRIFLRRVGRVGAA
ncbi:isoleucine--tRNA ligase [Rubrobacter taiwanensis]|jgi:isoleucyl-tRNA synthetase|uniref:Isoleucine--tRNA ligase n=1 Tax=Rubrobacter taiwanensis TaxID=185139 RepID=A0A4R1BH24_9ACTN|nr:isoleucine--tRNA ligase [Rubrobacter taiwanensis]TCJ16408.1 isoleucine--tRNA ligase [Rubrobacter taiwanensis]